MSLLLITIGASLMPFLSLFGQSALVGGDMRYVMANVAGFMGMTCLTWQMVLGTRYVKTKLTGKAGDLIRVHMLLGIWGMFFILLHPLLEMMTYQSIFIPTLATTLGTYVLYGQMAFALIIMVWITSAWYRNKMPRKVWYAIHLSSYPMMLLMFFHAPRIGRFLHSVVWVQMYWFALLVIYAVAATTRIFALFVPSKKTL